MVVIVGFEILKYVFEFENYFLCLGSILFFIYLRYIECLSWKDFGNYLVRELIL